MIHLRNVPAAALLAAALAAAAPVLHAQSLTAGGMEGVVHDAEGVPVGGALVTVTPTDGSAAATATTDPGGGFALRLLAPGSYDVLVERIGYQPRRITAIPVDAGALARVDVPVGASSGPAVQVESTPFPAGTRAGFGPPTRLRLGAGDLATLPADGRDLAAAARFSSLFPSLSSFDPASRAIWVDGVRFTPVRLPGGVRDPLGTAAFAFRWLDMAELATAPADVEWFGGGGSYLHAFTRRGTKDVSAAAEGVWSGSSLGATNGFPSASVNGSGMEGGALISGSLGGAAGGGFALGAEVRRTDTPLQLGTRDVDFASQLATVALDSFGVTLRGSPQVVRTELGSAFARIDAPLGGGSTLAITAAGSTLLTPEVQPTAFLGGGGGSAKGSDAFVAATLTARAGDDAGVEVRATGSTSSRDFAAGDTAAGVALTRILSGALGFGANESFPGRYARTEAGGTGTLFYHMGAHLLKAGGGAAFVHHDRAYAPGASGLFTFSDADAFARGEGTFTQTVGARSTAAFSLPRFSAFVQDTWSPAAGVELLAGVRYDMERYPASDVRVDTAWALRSGMITARVPGSAGVIQPRAALTVDPGGRHEWLLRA
ncbi:MAG: carboxypeptidase-like regulatory domain-containing protein, partial [Longimicrobiaceae bacterium]